MSRSTLDRLISSTGLIVAVVLLASAGALFYAHTFVHNQVYRQLAAEEIRFPASGTTAITSLPPADQAAVSQYAGQQLVDGAQAEVFADHFIAVHLQEIGGGQTYAQLSAAATADPTNTTLENKVQTVFRGETLRGMLLNAYAFDTMASVAYLTGVGALIASVFLFVLASLGFYHAGRVKTRRR